MIHHPNEFGCPLTFFYSIRFPNLENEINKFAQANSLSFSAAVNLLVNSAIKDPKLINPNKKEDK